MPDAELTRRLRPYPPRAWLVALLLIMGQRPCWAQKPPGADSFLGKGIRSTAFIYDTQDLHRFTMRDGQPALGIERRLTSGSAFCISERGYYITNEHVVAQCPENFSVRMSLWCGVGACWDVDALVVRKDKTRDLALLKVVKRAGIYAPPLAPGVSPARGTSVTAFGFPGGFGKGHSSFDPDFPRPLPASPIPDVTVSSGKITNLYGVGGVLKGIEADVKVASGSSGGPLLNRKGQVVGVVEAINRKTGGCLAIPVRTLKEFLARPEVALELDPPTLRVEPMTIPVAQRAQERSFVVKMCHANGDPFVLGVPAVVRLHLSAPGMASRALEAQSVGKGVYVAHAVPVPSAVETHLVTLTARRGDHVTCYYRVKDQVVRVGGEPTPLSRLARISNGNTASVVFADGTQQAVGVTGLDQLELPQRDDAPDVSLNTAETSSIVPLPTIVRALDFHAEVRADTRVLAEQWGQIGIQDAPPRPLRAGMVVVCADEWPTNSVGGEGHKSELTPSTRQYIRNIANLLTSGAPGHLLIYTDHWTFGRPVIETLLEDGHTVTVATEPMNWNGYDAIFLAGHSFPTDALIRYVRQGGRVYVAGGCGNNDGALCNGFLHAFGLELGSDGRADEWRVEPNVGLPLFAGVKALKMVGVSPVTKLPGNWPNTFLTPPQFGVRLWGLYSADMDILAPLRALP